MFACKFDFVEPHELDQALQALAVDGAVAVAGGTDLLRDMKVGRKRPSLVVSLARLEELKGVRVEAGELIVGPLTTLSELSRNKDVAGRIRALTDATSRMATPQVRNRGTIGGNLCNARPCADTAPPTIVAGGILEITGKDKVKTVPASKFFKGPGQTVLGNGDLLTAIRFPKQRPNTGSAFVTMTNRKAAEITITSVTASMTLESEDGRVLDAHICLGSVGPVPLKALRAEEALKGGTPGEDLFRKAAVLAVEDSKPIDDFRGSADFRRWLVEALTRRALALAFARAKGAAN